MTLSNPLECLGKSLHGDTRIKVVKGVTVVWPDGTPRVVAAEGPHADAVEAIAAHLRSKLKPAS